MSKKAKPTPLLAADGFATAEPEAISRLQLAGVEVKALAAAN